MKDKNMIRALRIPLYKLYYIESLDEFNGLDKKELNRFFEEYSTLEIEKIIKAVRWAVQNPKYDFRSLLPGLQYSNASIYSYICKLDDQFTEIQKVQ